MFQQIFIVALTYLVLLSQSYNTAEDRKEVDGQAERFVHFYC